MDRFLPMKGNQLSSDTWGTSDVRPRYVDNGIEDRVWSYWGGNIRKGEDGKYHLMVADGWKLLLKDTWSGEIHGCSIP